MATAHAKCKTCGNRFLGTPRSRYCTPACRQKAHRRRGGKRNADRNAEDRSVTVSVTAAGHTAEALAVLAELDAELADSAAEFGEELAYSAADRAAREAAACEIDRTVWLRSAYDAAVDDPALLARERDRARPDPRLMRLQHTDGGYCTAPGVVCEHEPNPISRSVVLDALEAGEPVIVQGRNLRGLQPAGCSPAPRSGIRLVRSPTRRHRQTHRRADRGFVSGGNAAVLPSAL
ncbi:hypothetical protein AB4Z39_33335 [Mycobacterium adipatum]